MSPLVYIVFIVLSFLASITVYMQSATPVYLRLFPVFLLCTLIVELISFYYGPRGKSPIALYNFFTSFEFLFYMFVVRSVLHNARTKRIIVYIACLYIITLIINFIFIQNIHAFSSMTYALGCLIISVISIFYFYELFQTQSINLVRQPAFWICAGLLFYYCCSFPIYGLFNYLNRAPKFIVKNLATIALLLNVFLYSSFTIAFLCRIRARNSTS